MWATSRSTRFDKDGARQDPRSIDWLRGTDRKVDVCTTCARHTEHRRCMMDSVARRWANGSYPAMSCEFREEDCAPRSERLTDSRRFGEPMTNSSSDGGADYHKARLITSKAQGCPLGIDGFVAVMVSAQRPSFPTRCLELLLQTNNKKQLWG